MKRLTTVLRSIGSLVIGLFVISLVVEGIEFVLVGMLRGDFSPDPEPYFATRNQTGFLIGKMFYNLFGAACGGVVAYLIAPSRRRRHLFGLAAIQVLAFGYAMWTPSLRSTGPLWMWVCLIPVSVLGIALGGVILERRRGTTVSTDTSKVQ